MNFSKKCYLNLEEQERLPPLPPSYPIVKHSHVAVSKTHRSCFLGPACFSMWPSLYQAWRPVVPGKGPSRGQARPWRGCSSYCFLNAPWPQENPTLPPATPHMPLEMKSEVTIQQGTSQSPEQLYGGRGKSNTTGSPAKDHDGEKSFEHSEQWDQPLGKFAPFFSQPIQLFLPPFDTCHVSS